MFLKLMSALLQGTSRPGNKNPHRSHPCSLSIETLEERSTPAVIGTLTQAGHYLMYTPSSAGAHPISISGTDAAFSLKDGDLATDLITYNGVNYPATTGVGTAGRFTVPSAVTTILINAAPGISTITVPSSLTTTRSLQATAVSFNLNADLKTDGVNLTTRGGVIFMNNGDTLSSNTKTIAGSIYLNGPVVMDNSTHTITADSVIDGNILFYQSVTATGPGANLVFPSLTGPLSTGGNITALGPLTIGGNLTIGSAVPGANSVQFLKTVNVGGALTVAAQSTMTLSSTITANDNVTLTANGTLTLQGGLTETNAGAAVILSANQNNVGTAGFTSGMIATAGTFVLVNVGGTGVLQVQGVNTGAGGVVFLSAGGDVRAFGAINAPGGGSVNLTAGGGIQDFNGSAVNINTGVGGSLTASAGSTGINLDTQVGFVSLTATAPGSGYAPISLRNTGQPLTVLNATTTSGSVIITNNDDVTVAGPISAVGTAQNVTVSTLPAPTAVPPLDVGNVTINAGATISAPGGTATITTYGFIQSAGGSSDAVAASSVVLQAGTGISGLIGPLGTSMPMDADFLSAVTGSGGIAVENQTLPHPLTVTTAVATTGNVTISTPTASALSPNLLLITGAVTTNSGNILLQCGSGSLVLSSTANVGAAGTAGAITLNAAQDLRLNQGSQVYATTNLLLNDGLGTFPSGTLPSNLLIQGTIAVGGSVTLNGSSNADFILVSGNVTAPGGLTIVPGLGPDFLFLTPSVGAAYTIDLEAPGHAVPDNATDSIFINSPASTVAAIARSGMNATGVTFTAASGFKPWTINFFNSVDGDNIAGLS